MWPFRKTVITEPDIPNKSGTYSFKVYVNGYGTYTLTHFLREDGLNLRYRIKEKFNSESEALAYAEKYIENIEKSRRKLVCTVTYN